MLLSHPSSCRLNPDAQARLRRSPAAVLAVLLLLVFSGLASEAQAQCTVPSDGVGSNVVFESCQEGKDANDVTSVTIPTPAALQFGDLLIAAINTDGNPGFTTPADWSLVQVVPGGGNAASLAVYARVVDGSEAASYTFTWSVPEEVVGFIMRFSGSSGNYVFGTAANTTGAPTAPSISTAGNSVGTNNLILRLAVSDDDDQTDDPVQIVASHNNINQDGSGGGNGTVTGAAAYVQQSGTGPTGSAAFASGSEEWAAMTMAIEPAGGTSSPGCTVPIDGSGSRVVFERCEESKGLDVATITQSVPVGITTGDLLVTVVSVDGSHTVSDDAGAWVKASETVSNGAVTLALFTRVVDGTEAAAYSFSWTGNEDVLSYMMHFSGTTGNYVSSLTNTGATGNPQALSVNTTANTINPNNNLILRIAARDGFGQPVDPLTILSGHNNINQDQSEAQIDAVSSSAAYVEQISAGPSGTALFASGTEEWVTQTLAIEPPAAPITDPVCPGINGTVVGNQLVVLEDCSEAKLATNASNITISTPATTAVGDLLLLVINSDDDEVLTDLASAWTPVNVGNGGNAGPTLGIYSRIATSSDAGGVGSYIFATGSSEQKYAYMLRFTGASGVINSTVAIGSSSTPTAPSITTSNANNLVLRLMAADGNPIIPDPAVIVSGQRNITLDYSANDSGNGVSGGGVYVSRDSAGTGTPATVQFTLTAAEQWRAASVALQPVEFRFSHDGSLSLCAIEEVTISAVNSAGQVLPNFTGTVSLSTDGSAGGSGAWSVGSTGDPAQGTLDNTLGGDGNNGQASYTFVSGDAGSVTLEFTTDSVGTVDFDLEWNLGLRSFTETQTLTNDPPLAVDANCEFRIQHDGTAGTCGSEAIIITLVDSVGVQAENYINQTATISLSSGTGGDFSINTGAGILDPNPDNDNNGTVNYTFVAADNGQVVLNYDNVAAGTVNFDVTDAVNGYVTDTDLPGSYDPDLVISACEFRLSHDGFSDVCSVEAITLEVVDSNGALITGFEGVVTLSNDVGAGTWTVNNATNIPVPQGGGAIEYTFSPLDAGSIVLDFQLPQTNADVDFQVTSTTPGIAPPSGVFDPLLDVASCSVQLDVNATTNVCGVSETLTVTVFDRDGGVPTGSIGTLVLNTSNGNGDYLSTTGNGVLANGTVDDGLATYTFDAADSNTVSFEFFSDTVGSLTFTASSTYITFDAAGSNESLEILGCEFRITHSGATDVCSELAVNIAVFNANGDAVIDYTGTVNLSTSSNNGTWALAAGDGTLDDPVQEDGNATYEFVATDNGQVDLSYSNLNTETVNLNVTDGTTQDSNTAFDPDVTVSACNFRISMVDSLMNACSSEDITITIYNSQGVVDTDYTGTVTISTTSLNGTWTDAGGLNGVLTDTTADDGLATYQFDAADAGTATFTFFNAHVETTNIQLQAGNITEDTGFDPDLVVNICTPTIQNSVCYPGSGPGNGNLTINGADPGRMVVMVIFHVDPTPKDVTSATFNGVNMTQISEIAGLNTDVEMWGILNAQLPAVAGSYFGDYAFDTAPVNAPSMCMVELSDAEQAFPQPDGVNPGAGQVNANSFLPDGDPLDLVTTITTEANNAFILSAGLSDFTQGGGGNSWFNSVTPNPPMTQFFFGNNNQNPEGGTGAGSIGNKNVAGQITVTDTDTQDTTTSAAHIVASFNPRVQGAAQAEGFDPLTLQETFSGNLSYRAIGSSMRPSAGGYCTFSPSATAASSTATLSLPGGATVERAFLYWMGSGEAFERDDNVTFGPTGSELPITSDESFLIENAGRSNSLDFFAAFKEVTPYVSGSGDYTLGDLTVQDTPPWNSARACAGGWSLIVLYSHPDERFNTINLFHGFQPLQDSSTTLVATNFRVQTTDDDPAGYLPNGKLTVVTAESDEGTTGNEAVSVSDGPGLETFTALTNSFNPAGNVYNSTVTRPIFALDGVTGFFEFQELAGLNGDGYQIDEAGPDALEAGRSGDEIGATWGVDVDTYYLAGNDATGPLYNFGQPGSEAEEVGTQFSSGDDLVLLIAQVFQVTNFPLADIEVFKSEAGDFKVNGSGQYLLDVVNNGNSSPLGGEATGQIIVADVLPNGLTLDSVSGTGWDCSVTTTTAFTCVIDIATQCDAAAGCGTTTGALQSGESLATITANVLVGDTSIFPSLSNNVKNVVRMQHNGGNCVSPLTAGIIPDPADCDPAPQFDIVNLIATGATDINDMEDKSSGNNNVDSIVTEVRGIETDLGINKSVVGILEAGGTSSYSLTVTNFGPDATTGSPDGIITVTDTQPAGVTFDSASGTGWSCTLGPVNCTYSGVLGAGASSTVTINLTVNGAEGNNVTNTAAVQSGTYNFDTNSGNNSDTDITEIVAAPVSSDQRFMFSVSSPGNNTAIGGLSAFENADLAIFNPLTDVGTLFYDDSSTGFGLGDIDALHLLKNGHLALSAGVAGSLGGNNLAFEPEDVVVWDPILDQATLLFDGSAVFDGAIDGNHNIDALYIRADGNLVFSIVGSASITFSGPTTLNFNAGDLVEYDPSDGSATLLIDASAANIFNSEVQVDGFYIRVDDSDDDQNLPVYLLTIGDSSAVIGSCAGCDPSFGSSLTRDDFVELDLSGADPVTENQFLGDQPLGIFSPADSNRSLNALHLLEDGYLGHFSISQSEAGNTCQAGQITITKHAGLTHSADTDYAGSIRITTDTAQGDWSIASGSGTLVNGTADDGAAIYTFVPADNGQVTLFLAEDTVSTINVNVTNGISSELGSEDPNFVYNNLITAVSYRDEWSAVSYNNNDGSTFWASDWSEIDAAGSGPGSGNISAPGGRLEMTATLADPNPSIARTVDLSLFTVTENVSLSFDYSYQFLNSVSDALVVEARASSSDPFTVVQTFSGLGGTNLTPQTSTLNLTSLLGSPVWGSDMEIRFRISAGYTGTSRFFLDNIEVETGTTDCGIGSMNHYEIQIDGITGPSTTQVPGISCVGSVVTITGHDLNHFPSNPSEPVTLQTSTGEGNWTLISGLGSFNNGTLGDGLATYTFAPGEVTASFLFNYTDPDTDPEIVNFGINTAYAVEPTEDPSLAVSEAGLLFYNEAADNPTSLAPIPTQIAGKLSSVAPNLSLITIEGVRSSDEDPLACSPLFDAGNTLSIGFAGECLDPAVCSASLSNQLSINGVAMTPASANGGAGTTAPYTEMDITMVDQGAGRVGGNISFQYDDAGEIEIHARYQVPLNNDIAGILSGDFISGSSLPLVVRPFGFDIDFLTEDRGNNGLAGDSYALDANGTVVGTAGVPVSTTISAVTWQAADDLDNNGIPDDGATLYDNPVTPNFGNESTASNYEVLVSLDQVVAPVNGVGSLSDTLFPAFSNGSLSKGLVFDEVGIIDLSAQLVNSADSVTPVDFMGSGSGLQGNVKNVGRFVPNDFLLSGGTISSRPVANAQLQSISPSNFTYMGEEFGLTANITARNGAAVPAVTRNYVGDFAKLSSSDLTADRFFAVEEVAGPDIDYSTRISGAAPDLVWNSDPTVDGGEATMMGNLIFNRQTGGAEDGPYAAMTIGLNTQDSDGVPFNLDLDIDDAAPADLVKIGEEEFRYGRLLLLNAFGPEREPLGIGFRIEYWNGTEFVINTDDSSTSILYDASTPGSVNRTLHYVPGSFTGNLLADGNDVPEPGESFIELAAVQAGTDVVTSIFSGQTQQRSEVDVNLDEVQDDRPFFASPPGVGFEGGALVEFDLDDASQVFTLEFLSYDWRGAGELEDVNEDGDYGDDPRASIEFGSYRGHDRVLNWQEVFSGP